jgi:Protein of unknown function (DUF3606)
VAYPGRLHRCVQYPFVTRTDERVHVGSLDFRRTCECVEEPGDAPTRLGVFDTSAATPQLSHPRHPAPRPGWGTRTSSTPNAISSWRRIGSTTVSYWTTTLGYSQDELAAAMARVGHSANAVRRELARAWGYGHSDQAPFDLAEPWLEGGGRGPGLTTVKAWSLAERESSCPPLTLAVRRALPNWLRS